MRWWWFFPVSVLPATARMVVRGTLHAGWVSTGLGFILGLGFRVRVGVRVRVTGGLLPTTSHSTFYSRVSQIAIFSHCQPGGYLTRSVFPPNPPIIVIVHGETDRSSLVETEMVLIPDAH